ncbi:MAG: hypothetical protein C4B56_02825 [Candidatus Methanophagaceae archaeon]|nr:MAG: hypothetical protein C4B56_02825 [Methanophagales archaeon]
MVKMKVEEKGDGIFIPRELLDELEIDEANVLVRGHEIVIRGKSLARKLRGIVKTRLSVEELEELYHTGI